MKTAVSTTEAFEAICLHDVHVHALMTEIRQLETEIKELTKKSIEVYEEERSRPNSSKYYGTLLTEIRTAKARRDERFATMGRYLASLIYKDLSP